MLSGIKWKQRSFRAETKKCKSASEIAKTAMLVARLGIDTNRKDKLDNALQKLWFRRQMEMGKEARQATQKPIAAHDRK